MNITSNPYISMMSYGESEIYRSIHIQNFLQVIRELTVADLQPKTNLHAKSFMFTRIFIIEINYIIYIYTHYRFQLYKIYSIMIIFYYRQIKTLIQT